MLDQCHHHFQNFDLPQWILYPKAVTPHSPLSQPCNHESTFCSCEFAYVILKPNLKCYFKLAFEAKLSLELKPWTACFWLYSLSGVHADISGPTSFPTLGALLGETDRTRSEGDRSCGVPWNEPRRSHMEVSVNSSLCSLREGVLPALRWWNGFSL